MKILEILMPIVVDEPAQPATVAFYEQLQGVKAQFLFRNEAGLAVTKVGSVMVVHSSVPAVLAGPRGLHAILSVDDLDAYWTFLAQQPVEVVAPPAVTPDGRNFFVRHADGHVLKYLQFNAE
jgi:hypothetical protein